MGEAADRAQKNTCRTMDGMKWTNSLKETLNVVKEKAAASLDQQYLSKSTSASDGTRAGDAHSLSSSVRSPMLHKKSTSSCSYPSNSPEVNRAAILEELHHDFFTACQKDDYKRAFQLYTMAYQDSMSQKQHQQRELDEQKDKQHLKIHLNVDKVKANINKEWKILRSKLVSGPVDNEQLSLSAVLDNEVGFNITSGSDTDKDDHSKVKTASKSSFSSTSYQDPQGFLEQHMDPCEFFPPSYFHSHLMKSQSASAGSILVNSFKLDSLLLQPRRNISAKMKSMSYNSTGSVRSSNSTMAMGKNIATNTSRGDVIRTATTLNSGVITTTTPLHEAARLAYPPLLLRMLRQHPQQQQIIDLSLQDWKQRTVLHYICGGVTRAEAELYSASQEVGLKSFYYCTMDQKRQRETDKKERVREMVEKFKSKLDITKQLGGGGGGGGDGSKNAQLPQEKHDSHDEGASISSTKSNPNVWSKIQGKVSEAKSELQSTLLSALSAKGATDTHTSITTHIDVLVHSETQSTSHVDVALPLYDIKRRLECLSTILSYSDDSTGSTLCNPVGINTVDCRIRTALHYAASLGRLDLVHKLLRVPGLLVTIVDEQGRTACELSRDTAIQSVLEAKAVFDSEEVEQNQNDRTSGSCGEDIGDLAIPYAWFETWGEDRVEHERQSVIDAARDQLLHYLQNAGKKSAGEEKISALDDPLLAFRCRLTNAQYTTLLEKYNWSIEALMSAIQEADAKPDAIDCNNKISEDKKTARNSILYDDEILSLAPSLCFIRNRSKSSAVEEEEAKGEEVDDTSDLTCLICYSTAHSASEEVGSSASWTNFERTCHHGFCTSCLNEYIATCYISPSTRVSTPTTRIPCPHFGCSMLIPESKLPSLVSENECNTLKGGERELFVLSSKNIKYCPHPGCDGIVHANPSADLKLQYGEDCLEYFGAVCTASSEFDCITTPAYTYEGMKVDPERFYSFTSLTTPPNAHRFCFSCGSQTPHWPASCSFMDSWRATIKKEMKGIVTSNETVIEGNFEDVAHHLWIKANTRPCPKCKTPIEKNDGCNHMTCSNRICGYEFCWICRKDWSLHSSETGGDSKPYCVV